MAPASTARRTRPARSTPRPAGHAATRSQPLPRPLHLELPRLTEQLTSAYRAAIRAVRQRASRGAIHTLRITTRRIYSLLTLLQAVDPQPKNEPLERYLEAPFGTCGQLRDLQVMARRVRTMGLAPTATAQLHRIVERLKPRVRARAMRALTKAHPRRIEKMLQAWTLSSASRLQQPAAEALAVRHIERTLAAAARELSSAQAHARSGNATAIHHARIVLKQRRYLLKLVATLGLRHSSAELARLRQLQQQLGELTDQLLMLRIVERYARKHPRAARRLAPLQALLAAQPRRHAALGD
ncbi:MAG: CHAD domain-containing protein [Proteobacteria bacterium]|nr:CHAD domain-containing protein [Pseudomonadota bacterium]